MYITAILCVSFLFYSLAKKYNETSYLQNFFDLFNYSVVGVIIGARLGYVFFYNALYYIKHPLEIIWPYANGHFIGISGLSYHGGALGFILGIYLASAKYKLNFLNLLNRLVLLVPLGYTFGRLGNFLNLELYGRATNSLLGMYFPTDPTNALRFPSQLMEACGEGLVLFAILLYCNTQPKLRLIITPLYMIGYALARFIIEYFREPDSFQNLLFGVFSYGQILSVIMFVSGLVLIPIFNKYVNKKI